MDASPDRLRERNIALMLRLRQERENRARADYDAARRRFEDAAAARDRAEQQLYALRETRRHFEQTEYGRARGKHLSLAKVDRVRQRADALSSQVEQAFARFKQSDADREAARRDMEHAQALYLQARRDSEKWIRLRDRAADAVRVANDRLEEAVAQSALEDAGRNRPMSL